ncbi:MAG: EamA family transporter [Gemmatimonadota bacterium]|nr:MAG: EamA family transporter [Gemmatimonadota bacterium]
MNPPPSGAARRGVAILTEAGLVAMAVIWGINFSVIKVALTEMPPLAFNALRFPMAAAALVMMLRLQGPLRMPDRSDVPRIIALGLIGNVGYQLLFIYGIELTLAGNAALMLATTPVWTLILATLLGLERHGALVWTGVFGALAGMVLVVLGGSQEVAIGSGGPTGDLLMVGSASVWAVYTVGSQDLTRRYGALPVTTWTLGIGAVSLAIIGGPQVAQTDLTALSTSAWLSLFYAGVLSIAVAYLLWYRGVEHIGSSRTSAFSNLVPLVALVVAWLWLGEQPTLTQLGGAAIIIGGVWLTRHARLKQAGSA